MPKRTIIIIIIIIIIITLFNEGRDIDYWSPSSFHNGPPTITTRITRFLCVITTRNRKNQFEVLFSACGSDSFSMPAESRHPFFFRNSSILS